MQLLELGEDQLQSRLNLFVGIEDNGARTIIGEPRRERHTQFAARRFLPLALMKPHPDLMQLRLAHDPGQAQQQTIMIGARIIKPFAIRNQHAEH